MTKSLQPRHRCDCVVCAVGVGIVYTYTFQNNSKIVISVMFASHH